MVLICAGVDTVFRVDGSTLIGDSFDAAAACPTLPASSFSSFRNASSTEIQARRLLKNCSVVIRRQLDNACEHKPRRLYDRSHIVGCHPHLRLWSARLSKDSRFLARPTVPIDYRKAPIRFQDCRDAARKPRLVRDAVEGVCYEDEVNWPLYQLGDGVRIALDKITVGRPGCGNLRPSKRQHARIDVDGNDAPGHKCKRSGEKAVATTKIARFQARPDTQRGENLLRPGPQCLPPIGVGHRSGWEKACKGRIVDHLHDQSRHSGGCRCMDQSTNDGTRCEFHFEMGRALAERLDPGIVVSCLGYNGRDATYATIASTGAMFRRTDFRGRAMNPSILARRSRRPELPSSCRCFNYRPCAAAGAACVSPTNATTAPTTYMMVPR